MAVFRREHPEWYHQIPEHPTIIQYLLIPFYNIKFYLRRLADNYGIKFLVFLACVFIGIKGFVYHLLGKAKLPYFLTYMNISSTNYQIFGTVALVPYNLTPFWGIASDILPIFGYHKRSYIFLATVTGCIAFLVLGFADLTADLAPLACIMFFLGNLDVTVICLLSEATYSEIIAEKPETGSDVVTWVWVFHTMGTLITTWVVGPMGNAYADSKNIWVLRAMFLVSLPIVVQVMIPVLLGWSKDERLPEGKRGIRYDRIEEYRRPFTLGMVIGILGLGTVIINLVNGYVWYNMLKPENRLLPVFIYAIFCGVVMISMAYWAFPRSIANIVTFLFLTQTLYIDCSGPLTTFYTAGPNCVPGGPNFSQTYFITLNGTVSSVMSIIAVILFQAVMSNWEFRHIFWVSTGLADLSGVFDIILVKRWNIAVHIPDKVLYLIGDSIIYEILYFINYMPCVIIIAKMCPKGMESTMYALLAAYTNFGYSVGASIGVYMQQAMGVQLYEHGPCNYENLPLLIFICHIACPLCLIPLTFIFIPKARLTDSLVVDVNDRNCHKFGAQRVTKVSVDVEEGNAISLEESIATAASALPTSKAHISKNMV